MDFDLYYTKGVYEIVVCFVFFISPYVVTQERQMDQELEVLEEYGLYYSYNRTREVLEDNINKSAEIRRILDEYDFQCAKMPLLQKNFPFVAIESTFRRTRHTVAQQLARRIRARVVGNPPLFMTKSSYYFNDSKELRRAFYSLGIHAAACRAAYFLQFSPTVIAGYWVDQAAFGIAKMFDQYPPESSAVYEWPDDLLKPDRVYLVSPENPTHLPVHPYKPDDGLRNFRERLLETLKKFRNPSLTEIPTPRLYVEMKRAVIRQYNKDFQKSYPVY